METKPEMTSALEDGADVLQLALFKIWKLHTKQFKKTLKSRRKEEQLGTSIPEKQQNGEFSGFLLDSYTPGLETKPPETQKCQRTQKNETNKSQLSLVKGPRK